MAHLVLAQTLGAWRNLFLILGMLVINKLYRYLWQEIQ